jgi:hypothetical protein
MAERLTTYLIELAKLLLYHQINLTLGHMVEIEGVEEIKMTMTHM